MNSSVHSRWSIVHRKSFVYRLWSMVYGLVAIATVEAAEIVIYGFEEGLEGWAIPDWAQTSSDYVGKELSVSTDKAEEGHSAMKMWAVFPGGRWTGAYVERSVEVTDWTPFGQLSVSVYVPAVAPAGLKGRIILTVGDDWRWTEMNRAVPLTPGEWTAITVKLTPESMDWKFFPDGQFRQRVDKLGLRIESDRGPAYSGPVFVDHVRLAE